jgi:hypothetical protein
MTTAETKEVLPSSFAPSPLQQIAGLGTLVGSAFGNKDAAGNKLIDTFKDVYGGIKTFFPSSGTELRSPDEIAESNSMMNFPG